jgi:hypothetical protein
VPARVARTLNAAIVEAVRSPEVSQFAADGSVIVGSTPEKGSTAT